CLHSYHRQEPGHEIWQIAVDAEKVWQGLVAALAMSKNANGQIAIARILREGGEERFDGPWTVPGVNDDSVDVTRLQRPVGRLEAHGTDQTKASIDGREECRIGASASEVKHRRRREEIRQWRAVLAGG